MSSPNRRLLEVVALVKDGKTGPSVEEIIAAVKAGLITEDEAIGALERDMAGSCRYRQEREIPAGLMLMGIGGDDDSVEADFLYAEAQNALLCIINSLPKRQGQCVELYYFDGMTQEQIAERLGIAHQTVSEHLTAALRNLATNIALDPAKQPSQTVIRGQVLVESLMRNPYVPQGRTPTPFFPFELWQRYNAGARWTRYNEYRPVIENRLPQYLCDCFAVPPVVGFYTLKQGQRKTRESATTPRRKPR